MIFKGNLAPDEVVVVECSEPHTNAPKRVLVSVAEVPRPGQPFVSPKHALIAAGGSVVVQTAKVTGIALRVDIDVPEPGGVEVRVTQGQIEAVPKTSVNEDEKWLFSIA